MKKKLHLLTIATIANKEKTIKYDDMQRVLGIDNIRELEDLIIEGANNSVLKGKLDQKSKHFEVDYAMGRDIRKVKIPFFVKWMLYNNVIHNIFSFISYFMTFDFVFVLELKR